MALEPVQNRYVAHLRSIRAIQEYLVRRAERHAIPAVDNTNVDRSVAAIHATAFGCLRRLARVRQPACACMQWSAALHSGVLVAALAPAQPM